MRGFAQVDVFTAVPGLGNPVAVVLDADGLTDGAMARLANWTNLSETTFVLPATAPGADYRVRIFTPSTELPFAGHPTLGTARALLDAGVLGGDGPWVQECGAGLVTVRATASGLSFDAPSPSVTPSPLAADALAALLGGAHPADPLLVDVGPRWLTARLTPAELDSLASDGAGLSAGFARHDFIGVNLYAVQDGVLHLRSLFGADGQVVEDPVCGSGNVAAAVHLVRTGHGGDLPPVYPARQGRHRGRDGRIEVHQGDDTGVGIRVGGPAVTVVTGTMAF